MAEMNDRPRSGIAGLVSGLLDKGYNDVVSPVLRSVASSMNDPNGLIQTRLRELDARVAELAAKNESLSPNDPILRALLADLETTLNRNAARLDGVSEDVQATGTDAAGTIQRQLALPGVTDAQLRAQGIVWNRPSPEAVARAVGYAQSEDWNNLLKRDFSEATIKLIFQQAVRGNALGWGPLRTAAAIRNSVQGFPASQANNLMRTLQLTSYRDGARVHQQANVQLIENVVRVATLDDRTCLACIALHGTVIWNSERNAGEPIPRVNDHHQGRCTSVIQVVGRSLQVRTGEQWFNSLPESRRAAIAGAANWAAMQAGAVSLADFPQEYSDPVFGTMTRANSLSGILGSGAEQYYQRNRQ